MSDLETLSGTKLAAVIARRDARHSEILAATIAAGMGAMRHSDIVELAKGSALSDRANLARDYLNARHDWLVAVDELDRRKAYHGTNKPIRRAA